jgi:pyruvate dehydrogenase E2 component (dihydrolipoamide acetyltransferase)
MAFEITIPRLGWSMEEGTFAGWLKKDGDVIRLNDVLFELEGEKALQEIESVDEGILRIPPHGPQPGAVLKVGSVVGYLVREGDSLPWLTRGSEDSATAATVSPATGGPDETPVASPSVRRLARQLNVGLSGISGSGPGGRLTEDDVRSRAQMQKDTTLAAVSLTDSESADTRSATPRARRTAKKMGIDWTQLAGSGRGGRVRERDVLRAANAANECSGARRIPIAGRRKVIAERLAESARQTVPVTLTTRADATNLVSLREQFKAAGQSPVPAVHDIISKLVADALSQFPLLAGRWDGDAIVLPEPNQIHLGLAVDTPEGLLVPVLRSVSTQSLLSLTTESLRIIQKARSGRLSGSDMQGAVFTISNLGGFGVDAFTPVINLPETAILGLGAIRPEPVVAGDGQIVVRRMMSLSLTFDHRAIDGVPAATFLQALVTAIGNPAAKLIALGS